MEKTRTYRNNADKQNPFLILLLPPISNLASKKRIFIKRNLCDCVITSSVGGFAACHVMIKFHISMGNANCLAASVTFLIFSNTIKSTIPLTKFHIALVALCFLLPIHSQLEKRCLHLRFSAITNNTYLYLSKES